MTLSTASWKGTTLRSYPLQTGVKWAKIVPHPPFQEHKVSRNPKFRRGVKYEEKVHQVLGLRYGIHYVARPWFCFLSEQRQSPQYCQPDGLLFNEDEGKDRVIICEAKFSHIADAYFQLNNKYVPVVKAAFPHLELSVCEIVKWYDPAVDFPTEVFMTGSVHEVRPGQFGLHILNR